MAFAAVVAATVAPAAVAQDARRMLVADGTRIQMGRYIYGDESDRVRDQVRRNPAVLPRGLAPACRVGDATPAFRVVDSSYGRFTQAGSAEIVYLYARCDSARGYQQGLLVLRAAGARGGGAFVTHFAYPFRNDVKLASLDDIDGNGRNELALISEDRQNGKFVRIVALSRAAATPLGMRAIEMMKPFRQTRLYADMRPGAPPVFLEYMRQMTATGWKSVQAPAPVSLEADRTGYVRGASRPGFRLAEAAFLTAAVWTALFVVLIVGTVVLIVRAFFTDGPKAARARRDAASERWHEAAAALPALQPLRCPNCGAGVPLRGVMLTCPRCATRFAAPPNYEHIRRFRDDAARRLRRATRYWRWANFLTSRWMSRALYALALWLLVSIPLLIVFWDQLAYLERFVRPTTPVLVLVGFSYVFWIPTLAITAGTLSPRARNAMPTLEAEAPTGHAETANCAQCGGAIRFEKADLATVCGYCGVETYRARLAWRLHNLANEARRRAAFSLIDAMAAVRAAAEDIVTTPMVIALLCVILPAGMMGIVALLDWLGLSWVLDIIGFFL